MSVSEPEILLSETATKRTDRNNTAEGREANKSLRASLIGYALIGAGASLLLAFVEWVDTGIQLTPVFESFSERLIFSAYFSLNILSGMVIGLLVGVFVNLALFLKGAAERILAKMRFAPSLARIASGLGVAALAAFLFNQVPPVNRYIIGLIREAEKIQVLNEFLLNHERSTSYLILMGLVISCSMIWKLARASRSMNNLLRFVWMSSLLVIMAAAYYVDSRIEVQLYEYSLHRSMFLLAVVMAMAVVATIYISSPRLRSLWTDMKPAIRKGLAIAALLIVVLSAVFTFIWFDKNQNLKTQTFYRTTQAKQHFKLIQWAMDFDRDGYSSWLGGGDSDDLHSGINPGQVEIVADGIDNNCIGGDLTQQDLEEWNNMRQSLHASADPSARRLNVIFIFIDTLRADHMSIYGYYRNTTPNIDKLAARSAVFEKAYTPAPNTFEALPKFMKSSHWDGRYKSWSEVLAKNGYHTMIFPGRLPTMLRHVKGVKEIVRGKAGGLERKIDLIINKLSSQPPDRPFFGFVYSVDPHRPYKFHGEFNYGSSLTDLYDGEIAFTDSQMGRLFDWMEKAGRLDDTVVVIMSDHGESLGERGVHRHSRQLYDEQARVPMIVYIPNMPHRRISDYVSTIDLGSTILNAVGLEYPNEYAGVSLLPLMRGEAFAHPPVYGEQTSSEESSYVRPDQQVNPVSKKYMVITQDGYKLIYNRNFYTFELFDLNSDPNELRNLFDQQPLRAREMKRLLGRFIDVVLISRPPDADEGQYVFGSAKDDEDEE